MCAPHAFFFSSRSIAPAPGQQTAAVQETAQIKSLEHETASDVQTHQDTMQSQLQQQGEQYQSDLAQW